MSAGQTPRRAGLSYSALPVVSHIGTCVVGPFARWSLRFFLYAILVCFLEESRSYIQGRR